MHESASLLSRDSASSSASPSTTYRLPADAPADTPPVADAGVPLAFIQLDARFRVSRINGFPLLILSFALFVCDQLILLSADESVLSDASCSSLLTYISIHSIVIGCIVFLACLMLFRPIAHKAFPFIALLLAALFFISFPMGLSLLFYYTPCKRVDWTVPYWHMMFLSWLHCWPVLIYWLLFHKYVREWINRGWSEGKMRGFLSKEKERRPYVGNPEGGR